MIKVESRTVLHLSNKEIMEQYGIDKKTVWRIRNGQEYFHTGYNNTEDSGLKKLRISRGMTRAQLAERVGCSQSMLEKLEIGDRTPSIKLAVKLAEALTCSIEDIIK